MLNIFSKSFAKSFIQPKDIRLIGPITRKPDDGLVLHFVTTE